MSLELHPQKQIHKSGTPVLTSSFSYPILFCFHSTSTPFSSIICSFFHNLFYNSLVQIYDYLPVPQFPWNHLNTPYLISVFLLHRHKINFCFISTSATGHFPFLSLLKHVFAMHNSFSSQNSSYLSSTFLFPFLFPRSTLKP